MTIRNQKTFRKRGGSQTEARGPWVARSSLTNEKSYFQILIGPGGESEQWANGTVRRGVKTLRPWLITGRQTGEVSLHPAHKWLCPEPIWWSISGFTFRFHNGSPNSILSNCSTMEPSLTPHHFLLCLRWIDSSYIPTAIDRFFYYIFLL